MARNTACTVSTAYAACDIVTHNVTRVFCTVDTFGIEEYRVSCSDNADNVLWTCEHIWYADVALTVAQNATR